MSVKLDAMPLTIRGRSKPAPERSLIKTLYALSLAKGGFDNLTTKLLGINYITSV